MLRHLVDHAGRLVTKEELPTRVWRDAIVSDADHNAIPFALTLEVLALLA